MKRTYIYTWIAIVCAVAGLQTASMAQVCTIRGTIYQSDGQTPAPRVAITVTQAEKTGKLYLNTARTYTTNALGKVTFTAPRTTSSDSAWIHVKPTLGNSQVDRYCTFPTRIAPS